MAKYSDSSIVHLNIGGKKFCTTVDTLTHKEPQSMLAAMFSGRHTICKDYEKGYVFVDRDGKHFRHILNWLRDGVARNLSELERLDLLELLHEAEYYQLLGLVDKINEVLNKEDDQIMNIDLTRSDIIKFVQQPVKMQHFRLRGVNLSGLDLSKLDLSFVDFSFACLKNVNFSHANLRCAIFQDVDAENAIFNNAKLIKCDFTRANLRRALLTRADLYDAQLSGCSLRVADLRYAKLKATKLTEANLEGANLEEADFTGANLGNAQLKNANLQRACLRRAILIETCFEGANLDKADVTETTRCNRFNNQF